MSAYIESLLKLMIKLDPNIKQQLNGYSEFSSQSEGIVGLIQAINNNGISIISKSNMKSDDNLEEILDQEESKTSDLINLEEIHKNSKIVLEQIQSQNKEIDFEENSCYSTIFNSVLDQIDLMEIK